MHIRYHIRFLNCSTPCLESSCFCCFCSIYILHFIICFSLSFLIFWLIFLPQEPKFKVTNASLTQFNFNNTNNTLNYNLAINITIRNPNKRVGIYYRRIKVIANYRNKRFSRDFEFLTIFPRPQEHYRCTMCTLKDHS
ncbi:hypothetical protein RchiOBHm_Chr6g0258251 [Rosa chinensis]|uniref:Late embryogenesis abundant protein, LEA-14 n=1 Tax=Rosa chinensis TaxID=74649 RepID=A0A2P6PMJ9_ROSCH|nr:hypothetical protein RchiOBHm_Chr6g0258251 [Rosa chinensis]